MQSIEGFGSGSGFEKARTGNEAQRAGGMKAQAGDEAQWAGGTKAQASDEALWAGGLKAQASDEALWAGGMDIVRRFVACGFEAYLVGGCVRDRLLGRALGDVDIATSALPEQVEALFERTIPTGLRHGTVTVLQDGSTYEVTTFRTESGYADARRPDAVVYVRDLREDLARRDFTINAMAWGLDGECIDPYGGRSDLARRVIRCVGDPRQRFGEDALRMVRAIRFAAALEFRIAKSVWRGIRLQAPRLGHVAMERIGAEWDKMMAGPHPVRACGLLIRSGLLAWLREPLPDAIPVALRADGVDTSACGGMRRLDELAEPDVRWMAFLAAAGCGMQEALEACRTLRMSGKRAARIAAGVAFRCRMKAGSAERVPARAAFVIAVLDYGSQAAQDWLALEGGCRAECHAWLEELPAHSVKQLAVRGDELVSRLGRKPGTWVALALRKLLEDVALGRVANEKEALLQAASVQADGGDQAYW